MRDLPKDFLQLSEKKRKLLELMLEDEGLKSSPAMKISKRKGGESIPLSFSQERLWFLDNLAANKAVYNIPAVVMLRGVLNIPALEKSINEIARRHEILRTRFAVRDGHPYQLVAPTVSISLAKVDIGDIDGIEKKAEALRYANEEVRRQFDLENGPLFRATLLRLAEEEHVLVLVMHHSIFEGWSVSIFFDELSAHYEACVHGRAPMLPDLPIQYADYAVWQRQLLESGALQEQLSYWERKLGNILTTLDLPSDRPRPTVQTFRGAFQSRKLPSSLKPALGALCQQEGVTMFMLLLTAFIILLHRYTGQDDILVGSPISNRNHLELEGLIGFLVNTVVLRSDLSGDRTFRELLQSVRETALEAYANHDIPFEVLVKHLQPERDTSQSLLFQVMFDHPNNPMPTCELAGLAPAQLMGPMDVHTGTTKTDLSMFTWEEADGVVAAFEYSTDLFDSSTVTRMLEHFQTLLLGIVADPEQRLSDLPLLTEAERNRLLVAWNDTHVDYPGQACIHELFEAQVERTPDAIAVIFKDEQLTYRELNQQANQLACYLRRLGVGPDVPVGICVERSLPMVIGVVGILKAGGAYVPLDPAYPKARLAFMLDDAQLSVVLSQAHLLSKLPEDRTQVVCLDRDWEDVAHCSEANPPNLTTAENLVYVAYTSGSTGRPKGVEVLHRGVVRLLFGIDYVELGPEETFLQLAPLSFDASTFELWGALLYGARCVLFPDRLPSSDQLGHVLQAHHVSILWLTASLFNSVVDEAPEALSGIRQLLVGGEALSVPHVRRALDRLSSTQLINGYGPTEGTTFTCCYPLPAKPGSNSPSIPIGRPVSNTQVYLLDPHLRPVPVGVPGELHVGGAGLARGYLNRPELTAERFIPNPFCDAPGGRLYKTGDLARYRPDGNIEFLGRVDDQVKIRGFRIEPGEIETVLGQHPAVLHNVVLDQEAVSGEKRLVAYIVLKPEQAPTVDNLRSYLREKLPSYMVPSAYVILESFPLTPNGKIDRNALPAFEDTCPEVTDTYIPPRTEIERTIAAIWQEVLHIEKVGLQDNFFDLGGHSLLLIQVRSKLRKAFNKDISTIQMFRFPTIRMLTEYFSQAGEGDSEFIEQDNRKAEVRRESIRQRKQLRQKARGTTGRSGIEDG